jgi:hypothetical protein
MALKKRLNEVHISKHGKSYLQIAGLWCFHPTCRQKALFVIRMGNFGELNRGQGVGSETKGQALSSNKRTIKWQ